MGGHDVWGRIAHFRGVITYVLSPFEQRAFAGWISKGFPNVLKRTRRQVFKFGIPAVIALMVYDYGMKEHARLQRKDPITYEEEYQQYLVSPEHQEYLKQKAAEEAKELAESSKKKKSH